MKYFLTTVIILLYAAVMHGQTCIKTEHGVSASWSNYSVAARANYTGAIGLSYLERTHFMLNSEIAFFTRRDLYPVYVAFNQTTNMDVSIKYWSLNTTARWKERAGIGNLFIGLGPSFDFKRSAKAVTQRHTGDFIADDFVFSILAEAGYFVDIERWRMELNFSYQNNLTTINTVARKGFISHMLSCSLGVGYLF